MGKKRVWLGVVIAVAFLAIYTFAPLRNVNEKNRRSWELKDEVAVADRVSVSIQVIKIDPAARQLTARLRFKFDGNIAQSPIIPKVNLRLLTNNSPGQTAFECPKGAPIVRIDATFPLEGDPNRYPFDRYDSNLLLFMDTHRPSKEPQAPAVSQTIPDNATTEVPQDVPGGDVQPSDMASVLEAELHKGNVPVPLSVLVSASNPGMKYSGEVIRRKDLGVTRVHLSLQRPDNLINASILVMCLMMGLALSVLAMVIRAITSDKLSEVLPLSFCISLIFGLPALRNIQPYVPPVGVLGDYFSFIWAELLVAASAIVTALTWVWRSGQKVRGEAWILVSPWALE